MPLRRPLSRALAAVAATALLPLAAAAVPGAPAAAAPAAPAATASVGSAAAPGQRPDLLQRIKRLGIVDSVKEKDADLPDGLRFFRIKVTQPVDHDDPSAGTFELRMSLLHRGLGRPMVMYTGGYNLYGQPFRSEPTQILDANQIEMEYRFFAPSRPRNPDWDEQLTIAQAAADQHRIIKAFKKIYQKSWVTTGGSKGGMTATYHRRFYPDDVVASVPYVAPNDVVDDEDVYNEFLSEVGGSAYADCRDAIVAVERRALGEDRAWFRDRFDRDADASGATYDIVGSRDVAFEAAVVDAFFGFWQYQPPSACADVPGPGASKREAYAWLGDLAGYYSDQGLQPYVPYYFQASYQLGAPEPYEDEIADVLRHPGTDVAPTFVPDRLLAGVEFDDEAMPDVDQWVRTESEHMIYVYGELDPWSAEPFDCGQGGEARGCERYYAPGGNHGSSISDLPAAEQQEATSLLRAWAGVGNAPRAADVPSFPALDRGWQTWLRQGR